MPMHPAPHKIICHSTYWLPAGDLYIIVKNTAFHIHQYFFEWDSSIFQSWLKEGDDTLFYPSRTFTATAFILDDISMEAFADFLWVFYNPTYSLYNTKMRTQWFGILQIAEHYAFDTARELCYRELSFWPTQTLTRILIVGLINQSVPHLNPLSTTQILMMLFPNLPRLHPHQPLWKNMQHLHPLPQAQSSLYPYAFLTLIILMVSIRMVFHTSSVLKSGLVQSLGPKMGNRQPQPRSLVAYFGATTTELLKTSLTQFSCLKKPVLTSFNWFFVYFYRILLNTTTCIHVFTRKCMCDCSYTCFEGKNI